MKRVFELNINTDQYIKGLAEINTSIRALRAEQKGLDVSTQEGSQKFEQNAISIKGLSEQYRFFQKEVSNLNDKNTTLKEKTDIVNVLMQNEAKTINELNQNTTALNKVKKNLNIEDEKERALIEQINKKIDENTNKVKENSSEVEKQKMNIGNYSNSIKDAFASINPLNGGMDGFIQRSQQAGGAGKLFTESLKGMITGVWGLVKASLAFIATPIGAVIAAISVVIGVLYNIFKSFTPIVDKVEQGFAALTAVFSVVKNTIIGLVTGAKSLGSVFRNLGGDMRDAAAASIELKKAQQDLNDAMEQQEINSAKARAEADKYMAISRDRSLGELKQAEMLSKANEIMKKDFDERKKIQDKEASNSLKALAIKSGVSEKEIKMYGDNFAKMKEFVEKKGTNLDKEFENYKNSIVKKYEIQGEENQFLDKNIARQNSLLEKAEQERQRQVEASKKRSEELRQAEVKKAQDEVALFESVNASKVRNLTETFEYEKNLFDLRNKALETSYNNGLITAKEYEVEKQNIINQYNDATLSATAENLNKELELWKSQNAVKLSNNKITSDAIRTTQIVLQDELYNRQKAIIEQTILDEQEKAIALQNLQNEHNTAIQTINDSFKAFNREQEALDYEIKIETLQLQSDNELAIKQAQYDRDTELLKAQLDNKELTEEQYNQKLLNRTKQFEKDKTDITNAENENRIALYSSAFGNIATIFGKNTAIGKSAGVAQATIDTYQAANKALATYPPPFSYIAAAASVATGIANVKKILSVKEKFSRGGWLRGRSHAGGGIPMTVAGVGGYEAEGGEAIINRRSSELYRPILSAINQAGGGVAFASGGVVSGADKVSDAVFNQIDITSQLSKIQVINVAEETAVMYDSVLKVRNRATI